MTDCLGQKNVPIKLANSPDWDVYQDTYNTRLDHQPAVIAVPTTTQHISDAVVCAKQFNVAVQPKGGGHSYASYSTPSDGMMIVLENFQNVSIDGAGIAKVGAGLRLGNMALALYNQGGRALSHGTCKGVGLGGHATGGGFGYSSRAWGLTLDMIVALDVIKADGTLVHCSQTENPDLYYVSFISIRPFEISPLIVFQGYAWRRRIHGHRR